MVVLFGHAPNRLGCREAPQNQVLATLETRV